MVSRQKLILHVKLLKLSFSNKGMLILMGQLIVFTMSFSLQVKLYHEQAQMHKLSKM